MNKKKTFRIFIILTFVGMLIFAGMLASTNTTLAEFFKAGFKTRITITRPDKPDTVIVGVPIGANITLLDDIGWTITDAVVISEGQQANIAEGFYQAGYRIQATAVSPNNPTFTTGILDLTLSAFSPSSDMPGQKAGQWYVHGEWAITDVNVIDEALDYRYSPHMVKGVINRELAVNPLVSGSEGALLSQPAQFFASVEGGQAYRGDGAFTGNTQFDEAMQLFNQADSAPAMDGGK